MHCAYEQHKFPCHLESGLTFEKEVRVILEGVVRLLHGNEAGVHCLPLLAVPRLCDQLRPELQDKAEDAVNDVHDRGRFLRQQTPAEVEGKVWGMRQGERRRVRQGRWGGMPTSSPNEIKSFIGFKTLPQIQLEF